MAAKQVGTGARRGVAEAGARIRRYPLLAGAVAATAIAAGAGGLLLRRLAGSTESTPATLAGATAVSVADAAKGSVIAAIRDAGDDPALADVERPTRDAVLEAAGAGADVTAAALGAVEGAASVAAQLQVSRQEAMEFAAGIAVSAARQVGDGAAMRVESALRDQYEIRGQASSELPADLA